MKWKDDVALEYKDLDELLAAAKKAKSRNHRSNASYRVGDIKHGASSFAGFAGTLETFGWSESLKRKNTKSVNSNKQSSSEHKF